MNITKVAAWSEIVSSVAVLATLVYLALQVQQNTAAIQAQTRQAMLEIDMQNLASLKDHPDMWLDRYAEGELSPESKTRLNMDMISFFRSREYQWFQYKNGLLDEPAWRSYQKTVPLILNAERTRNWWKQIGRFQVDPAFAELIDSLIEGQPDIDDYYERVMALK